MTLHNYRLFALFITSFTLLSGMNTVLQKHADHVSVYTKQISNDGRYPLVWQRARTRPFHELLLSWNAIRPTRGYLQFEMRVKRNGGWGPWLLFAQWGHKIQKTFAQESKDRFSRTAHCRLLLKTHHGTGFGIRVTAHEGATLQSLDRLVVCISNPDYHRLSTTTNEAHRLASVRLDGLVTHSQYEFNHPATDSICSPTATSVVINYLRKKLRLPSLGSIEQVAPACADSVYDQKLKIYGNWPLNVAQAYHLLEGRAWCHMQRLNSIVHLHSYLHRGLPLVVSVRGPLPGSASAYKNGHLLVVIGWDKQKQEVICLDSAFKDATKLEVRYKLQDFAKAWHRSRRTSYVFDFKR